MQQALTLVPLQIRRCYTPHKGALFQNKISVMLQQPVLRNVGAVGVNADATPFRFGLPTYSRETHNGSLEAALRYFPGKPLATAS